MIAEKRIKGCAIQVHFSFFAMMAFVTLFTGLSDTGWIFLFVLLHECGHLVLLLHTHAPLARVRISGLGIEIALQPGKHLLPKQGAWVALAGPSVNLLLAWGSWLLCGPESAACRLNMILGLFHLLPIVPLDGGLALKALLSTKLTPGLADRVSFWLSLVFLLPVAVAGFLLLLYTKNNLSLLALSMFLMLYLLFRNGKDDL